MRSATNRLIVALAAAAAVAAPTTAANAAAKPGAAAKTGTVAGVVVAREHARSTLVVAGAKGVVRTLRTSSAVPVGTRVSAKAVQLADSTYRAASVRRMGRAQRARVHAVVVSTAHGQLVLSAGGSTFSLRLGRGVAAVGGSPGVQPGDVVDASVAISGSGDVQESGLQQVGQTSLVQLEGTISSLSATTLVLAADQGAITTIAIPSSLTLPSTIAAGDRVEVLTQFAAGAFTLVSIQDDHAAASSDSGATVSGSGTTNASAGSSAAGGGTEQAQVEAEGIVLAVSSTSLTVQGEHASSVVFVVPAGIDVSAVQVGARVHAKGTLAADGTITLTRVEVQNQHEGSSSDSEVEAEGAVTAVDATSLTVQPGNGAAVTFTVPAGFDVSTVAVGAKVNAKGTANADGSITLAKLEVQGSGESGSSGSSDHGGSGSGDQSGSAGSSDQSGSTGSGGESGSSSSGSSDQGGSDSTGSGDQGGSASTATGGQSGSGSTGSGDQGGSASTSTVGQAGAGSSGGSSTGGSGSSDGSGGGD